MQSIYAICMTVFIEQPLALTGSSYHVGTICGHQVVWSNLREAFVKKSFQKGVGCT